MQALMERASRLVDRRRAWILLAWAILCAAAIPFYVHQTDRLTNGGFIAPNSQSATVDASLDQFPAGRRSGQAVVLRNRPAAPPGGLAAAIARARRLVATVKGAALVPAPAVRAPGGDIALVPIVLQGSQDMRIDAASKLEKRLGSAFVPRHEVTAYLVGQDAIWAAARVVQKHQLASAERVGFPISLAILIAAFGAVAAAALPIALAATSVLITGAVIYFLSRATDMSLFVTNAASMIGIGVAIDYSLFVLARYRQEIAAGADASAARMIALRTSGLAVVFSGLTVVICLLGLFLANSTTLRSVAMGMIVVVAVSVIGAVTLLPALIELLGRHAAQAGRVARLTARLRALPRTLRPRRSEGADFWTRWIDRVMRRPLATALLSGAAMLALAVPALSIHLSESAIGEIPAHNAARSGTRLAAHLLGSGSLGPVQELVTFRSGDARSAENKSTVASYLAWASTRPQVARVDPPQLVRGDPRKALLTIVPRTGPESPVTRSLVRELRARQSPAGARLARAANVAVGGSTGLLEDFIQLVRASMWKIALFIVGFSYLVLMVMLRSLVLPLKAVLMTLLSVASAYGVLVAIFQWGWLDGLLGYRSPGYIDAVAPPVLLALTFGLSMDYEVFMLSRIREFVSPSRDDAEAVTRGLRASAATISSAALVMVSVFAVFSAVGAPSIKEIGAGEAIAIALDVTLVRLALVPSAMKLLGRFNWWFPRALERRVPTLAYEAVSH